MTHGSNKIIYILPIRPRHPCCGLFRAMIGVLEYITSTNNME
nr:MAG TPA: hypothetical protein [Caudoviricetes sp.]